MIALRARHRGCPGGALTTLHCHIVPIPLSLSPLAFVCLTNTHHMNVLACLVQKKGGVHPVANKDKGHNSATCLLGSVVLSQLTVVAW